MSEEWWVRGGAGGGLKGGRESWKDVQGREGEAGGKVKEEKQKQ